MTSRQSFVEVYRDEVREYRWRFCSWNGNVLADSGEGYKRLVDCVRMSATVLVLPAEARQSTAWEKHPDGSRVWFR